MAEGFEVGGERAAAASARASSAPVQRGAGVGTSRATGTAASRTTNVVCSRRARYVKEVDASEGTLRFWQEIYDDQGKLVEIHEKYPVDKGHQKV